MAGSKAPLWEPATSKLLHQMRLLITSHIMPRTTLNLDTSVIRELRQRSEDEGIPMGKLASRLLADALKRERTVAESRPFRWISKNLGEPLVDLDDKEALRAALDGDR